MNRKPIFFLLIIFCFALAACQDEPPTEDPDILTPEQESEDLIRDTATPTGTPTPAVTPLPGLPSTNTPAPSGTPAPILDAQPSRTRVPSPTPFFIETLVVGGIITITPSGSTGSNSTVTPVAQVPGEINGLTELAAAAAAYDTLDTVRVVQTAGVDEEALNDSVYSLTQTCDVQRENNLYCRNSYQLAFTDNSDTVNFSEEAVRRSNQYWTRPSASADWVERTRDYVEDSGFTIDGVEQFLILSFVDNIQSVQTTILNGESVYRIQYNIDDDAFLEGMFDDLAVNTPSSETYRGTGTVWMGVTDKYPRRSIIDVDIIGNDNTTVEILIQSDFSNFNESVTIPNPNTDN